MLTKKRGIGFDALQKTLLGLEEQYQKVARLTQFREARLSQFREARSTRKQLLNLKRSKTYTPNSGSHFQPDNAIPLLHPAPMQSHSLMPNIESGRDPGMLLSTRYHDVARLTQFREARSRRKQIRNLKRNSYNTRNTVPVLRLVDASASTSTAASGMILDTDSQFRPVDAIPLIYLAPTQSESLSPNIELVRDSVPILQHVHASASTADAASGMLIDTVRHTQFREARARRRQLLNLKRTASFARNSSSSYSVPVAASQSIQHTVLIHEPWNFGKPTCVCEYCGALHWYEERTQKYRRPNEPKFSMCCMEGRVQLPLLKAPPLLLQQLLDYRGNSMATSFRRNIRIYNAAFAFTSMGGRIDNEINKRGGPYTYRLNGQSYHLLGSLAPLDGMKAKFAQLYIHDTENELANRLAVLQSDNGNNTLHEELVRDLLHMLDEHNVLVQSFRMARDKYRDHEVRELKLRLIGNRLTDGRQYNLPSCSEVAALLIGESSHEECHRDIIVEHKTTGLQRITELHPSFMALQYPLLFPYGEDGFRVGISHRNPETGRTYKQQSVTMRQYYAFRIQQRLGESQNLVRGGRLLQQYLVDAYACIEEGRLNWIRNNQKQLRAELYSGLRDAINQGDLMTDNVGRMTILPSTYTGGPRYRVQNYQDAMAICRHAGYPDLFLTFTCNSKWPEIEYFMEDIEGQKSEDRPDIVTRVFSIKLWELLNDIKRCNILGRAVAVVYTVEFQKRGLPHAHILVFLHPNDKIQTASQIDEIISAEIPDKDVDPVAFSAVEKFMIHGPCGDLNHNSPCMVNNKCSKHFPKRFHDITSFDDDGFPIYMRRNNGKYILKNEAELDNRYVVPYNRNLLVKYDAHLNVELCNRSRSVKYLFKYINKGPDRVTAIISSVENSASSSTTTIRDHDEIKAYLDCRYISAAEATWRIFQFDMFYREPAVERLSFHLPEQQTIYFPESMRVDTILNRQGIDKTMFTEWMHLNTEDMEARHLTYTEIPTRFVWKSSEKIWAKRRNGRSVGRIYYVPPTSGEKYYLRMLLNIVRGCRSYQEIRTVNGVVYPTFKEACYALGLLEDDQEWDDCLKEASTWGTGPQLRQLFCTILMHCEVVDPGRLWAANWKLLSEDILYRQRRLLNFPELRLSDEQMQNYALLEMEKILRKAGKSLENYQGMTIPNDTLMTQMNNRLISEELNYDRLKMHEEYIELLRGLNSDQKRIHDIVLQSINLSLGKLFFIYGSGGTGKTYLWRTLLSKIRSEGKIAIAVATSGIAALLLPGGRTAHSRFHIPLNPTEESTCAINKGTQLADLIMQTSLIIWDEAPMADKRCFEAVDRTLRDIMKSFREECLSKPFGGITTILGGDFRQILPVVRKGDRQDTVQACIKTSYIWESCEVHSLRENMRLKSDNLDSTSKAQMKQFADWILDIGDGKHCPDNGESWVTIPPDLMVDGSSDGVQSIVTCVYPDLEDHIGDSNYLMPRAILTPTNETVEVINDHIMSMIPGEEKTYLSSDSICKADFNVEDHDLLYPTEFLNTLKFPGFPTHILTIKKGVAVMLLRNINQGAGLCNGTRMKITQLGRWFVEGEVMSGSSIGEKILIPRITLSPSESKWPFVLKRRQYPISLCFAMTINKSQGQSLEHVGLFLPKQVFTHGQLYVALSRVTNRNGIRILTTDEEQPRENMVLNIVYKEIL